MKCNVGKRDKNIRIIVGIVVIAISIYLKSWWGVLGLLLILTGLLGRCGLYTLFNINTIEKK